MLKILEAQFQKRHYTPAQAAAVLSFDTESVCTAAAQAWEHNAQGPVRACMCYMHIARGRASMALLPLRGLPDQAMQTRPTLSRGMFGQGKARITCFSPAFGAPGAAAAGAGARRRNCADQRQPRALQAPGELACSNCPCSFSLAAGACCFPAATELFSLMCPSSSHVLCLSWLACDSPAQQGEQSVILTREFWAMHPVHWSGRATLPLRAQEDYVGVLNLALRVRSDLSGCLSNGACAFNLWSTAMLARSPSGCQGPLCARKHSGSLRMVLGSAKECNVDM